jgi:hypothetical protein
MSNSFSFDATAGASQSTTKPRFKGNEIYNVKFAGCEIQDIQGVKDPTALYKVIKFRYENDNGYYEHTVFEPRPDDFKRGENDFKNKNGNIEKIPTASNVESMMLFFKHNMDAFTPAIAKKIDNGEQSLVAKDWDTLRNLVNTIMEKGKDVENKIKLIIDNKGEPRFPGFFTGISREGKAYIRNNFIGQNIAFTPYEMKKIQDFSEAKIEHTSNYNLSEPREPKSDDLDLNFNVDSL